MTNIVPTLSKMSLIPYRAREQEVDQKMIKTIVNGMVTIDKGLTLDALKKVFIY